VSRQVLTIPDVPPTLLQRATADSLYSPVGHNHDAAYVNVTGDTMTGPLTINGTRPIVESRDNANSMAARWGQVATNGMWMTLNARYDGSAWNRDDTSKPSIMLTFGASADFAIYNQVAGANPIASWTLRSYISPVGTTNLYADSGSAALVANGYVDVQGPGGSTSIMRGFSGGTQKFDFTSTGMLSITPTAGSRGLSTLSIDIGVGDGHGVGGQWYLPTNWAGGNRTVPQGGMTYIHDANYGTIQFWAHPYGYGPMFTFRNAMTGVPWVAINAYGKLVLSPEGGDDHITSASGNLSIAAPGNVTIKAPGTVFHPISDNAINLGYPSFRWVTVYAVAPAINTSHVSLKRDFAPLDPDECVQAVLNTDWLSFNYNPPPRAKLDDEAYNKLLDQTLVARQQKGYVLGSDEYKTHILFGQSDRYSASTHADMAVVACALQQAFREIADLKARLA
jgi:hypothetical protein